MLPNVICSTVIQGRARSTTVLGSSLLLERDLEGKLYVNGKQVITRDVMASNGVLHVVDGVLIPENARSFSQLLAVRNLTEMARLVEAAGMTVALDSMTNATLFAPTNDAIRAVPDEVKQSWINNPEQLKQVLSYHVIQPQIRQPTLANNQLVNTSLEGQKIRINFYQSMPFFNALPLRATAQCASVMRWEQEACNGNVHIVDRVMIPPKTTISQWLANNRSFSIMTQLLKDTKLADILDAEGPYTVLAAPDVAFYQIPEETFAEITKDPRKAAMVLKQHILPEHLCCAGFRGDWFSSNRRRTLDGNWIPLQRHLDGSLSAGDATVTSCDQLATNGVIHVVEQVMLSKPTVLPFLSGTRRLGLPGMELIFNNGK
jgi:transforming growth factor-beta-induced protein